MDTIYCNQHRYGSPFQINGSALIYYMPLQKAQDERAGQTHKLKAAHVPNSFEPDNKLVRHTGKQRW